MEGVSWVFADSIDMRAEVGGLGRGGCVRSGIAVVWLRAVVEGAMCTHLDWYVPLVCRGEGIQSRRRVEKLDNLAQ